MFHKLNVTRILIQSPTHIRDIAQQTDLSPATVMRTLHKLEKQRAVNKTVQGRNHIYAIADTPEAKQLIHITEHYALLKALENPFIRGFVKYAQNITDDLVVIFGSYAKGTYTNKSDLDVYAERPRIARELRKFSEKVSVQSGTLQKDSEIGREIIKNHLIVQGVERFYRLVQ